MTHDLGGDAVQSTRHVALVRIAARPVRQGLQPVRCVAEVRGEPLPSSSVGPPNITTALRLPSSGSRQ
jgi:hypothetical protein